MATKKKKATTVAIQATKHGGSEHVVGIGNLRVMITNDDGSWFAQGLEIDYAAEGGSLAEVKNNFERGLGLTVHEHLNLYGTIEKLLQTAPKDVWIELIEAAKMKKVYSQITVHKKEVLAELPFQNIQYFERQTAQDIHAP